MPQNFKKFFKIRERYKDLILLFALAVALSGCAETIPKEALQLSQESLAQRQLQTRRYDSKDEKVLLASGVGVLQDLGFSLDPSEPELGVIIASKDRSAVEAGQVAGSIILGLLSGVVVPWDEKQKIRVSLVTIPGKDENGTLVRVTFQRIVWRTDGKVSKTEPLNDPKFYQEFFEKLSKAVFLEAHEL